MRKKLSLFLIVIACFCFVTLFVSCDVILDAIFGAVNPNAPDDISTHVHKMEVQSFDGEMCDGKQNVTYYKCASCNKYFWDEKGEEEITDLSALNQGHLYVVKFDENEHYSECKFCQSEKENSRGAHSSDKWQYGLKEHYKKCDVCGATFNRGQHDANAACDVCGRQADYKETCNGSYGYNQLAKLDKGKSMQGLYNAIDKAVKSVHDNAEVNLKSRVIGVDKNTNQQVSSYALDGINVADYRLTENETNIAVASYNYDHPLYYWISKQCGVTIQANDCVSVVTICVESEYASGAKRVEQNAKIYAEIDRYLSEVSSENNPYKLTKAFHDAIIDNISYALKSDGETAENAHWAHSIVGVFDNKSAVCEGYAKAFQLLLNAKNVQNIYVVGDSQGVGHAWNLVNLVNGDEADAWYWYDLTWDDQPRHPQGKIYDYFCKTDKVFSRDHTVSPTKQGLDYFYDLPAVAAKDYNVVELPLAA